jgi:hypothetical protein
MNIDYKKSAKLVLLLLSSILIATVSAQVYRYMYIDGSVTVGTAKLVWIKGGGAPGDSAVSGSTYTVDLDVEPGTPLNFNACVYLKNQDSVTHDMNISVTTAISAVYFTVCKMHIYTNSTGSWVYVDTLDMRTSDSIINSLSLDTLKYYRMDFEVSPTLSASGTYDFNIELQYE